MKKAWQRWLLISKKVISVEATIVFGIIFIVIVTPLSFIIKLINPSIFLGSTYKKRGSSYWNKIEKRKTDLSFARKQ